MKQVKKTQRINSNPFLDLTWMDIHEWAGSKIFSRGKSYQRSGSVNDLGITHKNELVAWVEGSAKYATKVSFKRGKLSSKCTCPYGINCKHGVAIVVEYLEMQKKNRNVPNIAANDKRILLIKDGKINWPDQSYDEWIDEYDDFDETDEKPQKNRKRKSDNKIDAFLQRKSREELVEIIKNITKSNSDVDQELAFKAKLSSQTVSMLVKTISKEIDKAASKPGWSNGWNHSGYTPDYSRVQEGLQKLFDSGKYDEIVTLGKKLYIKGTNQIEQSNDEGETIQEICDALAIVFNALEKCSLANIDKIELAIDWKLADEYSMTDGLAVFWKKKFSKNDWSIIADRLLLRLQNYKVEIDMSEFSRNYHRDKLTDQIINALERAGRNVEIIQLCIHEAPVTKSYERLVTILRREGKIIDAEAWIHQGIKATQDNFSGIASGLRKQLLEIYLEKKDWTFCAALKTDYFFERPSLSGYKDVKKACEKAKLWERVRPMIISFLTKGNRPNSGSTPWPLPETGISSSSVKEHSKTLFSDLLIEIALFEKDIDEALRLYDERELTHKSHSFWNYGWERSINDQIAEAVKETYPERSISIWKKAAEDHINRTSPKEYSLALDYLNRILKVMNKLGQEKKFYEYISKIREQNRRKIRLVEMLDGITGKRIIDE